MTTIDSQLKSAMADAEKRIAKLPDDAEGVHAAMRIAAYWSRLAAMKAETVIDATSTLAELERELAAKESAYKDSFDGWTQARAWDTIDWADKEITDLQARIAGMKAERIAGEEQG